MSSAKIADADVVSTAVAEADAVSRVRSADWAKAGAASASAVLATIAGTILMNPASPRLRRKLNRNLPFITCALLRSRYT